MSKPFILTDDGLRKYEQELEDLKTNKRKDIADKIKVALSFGDLSENSEYDEAKNDQAKLESRIATLEVMLKNAKIIDEEELSTEMIHVGSKLTVLDMEYSEKMELQIVGSTESDPSLGKISYESPIGQALINHKKGDKVTVMTPSGEIMFEVLDIIK